MRLDSSKKKIYDRRRFVGKSEKERARGYFFLSNPKKKKKTLSSLSYKRRNVTAYKLPSLLRPGYPICLPNTTLIASK